MTDVCGLTASALADSCQTATSWPLPGGGHTRTRWSALARLAGRDLVLARLVEAHADAVAILAELGGAAVGPDDRFGVWAAEVPGSVVTADETGLQVHLSGNKDWCSGATLLTHALVTVRRGDERLLCAVRLDHEGVCAGADTWAAAGMRRADTRTVRFTSVPATVVGAPGSYLDRAGFWPGGMGVAACWYGGSATLAEPLRRRVSRHPD
ncbi:MAG TPA: acyl-CoA dehydrogenase, partial [Mycobacteriales bacterium]